MVGIYGGTVSEVEEGEGVTKTGTYVSFECVLKIVENCSESLSELRNMLAKTPEEPEEPKQRPREIFPMLFSWTGPKVFNTDKYNLRTLHDHGLQVYLT
jgi:hypothetical protein